MARDGDKPDRSRLSQPVGFSSLREGDIPRILDIERACFTQPWSADSFREVIAARVFGSLAARNAAGELIGYVVFSEAADELHILNVAVHPQHRRQGLASAMVTHLHKYAEGRGRAFAYLEVRESNRAAQDLYAKLGYTLLTRRKEYYIDDRENAIVMVAKLKPKKKGWRR